MGSASERIFSKKRIAVFVAVMSIMAVFIFSCSVSYKFTGANISAQVKTISVQYFQNRASLV